MLDELDSRMANEPTRMQARRSTVEHPFGTIKHWMGHSHFQMKTMACVSIEENNTAFRVKETQQQFLPQTLTTPYNNLR